MIPKRICAYEFQLNKKKSFTKGKKLTMTSWERWVEFKEKQSSTACAQLWEMFGHKMLKASNIIWFHIRNLELETLALPWMLTSTNK